MAHSRIILFLTLALACQFATAQTSNDNLPDLSLSVYSGLASGCKNYKNMKYLIAGTWGLMLENEVQNKISSIRSHNKEDAYKLLNALYEIQPDLFKENLHAIGLSIQECKECERAILTMRAQELNKIKNNERKLYEKWKEEGVPDDVEPNVRAKLSYSGIDKTAAFIDSVASNDPVHYSFELSLKNNGSLYSVSSDNEELSDTLVLLSLFSFDELEAEAAKAYFQNINSAIDMPSIETINIRESRKSITHDEDWDAPRYECDDFDRFTLKVKFNLKKNTIKVIKGIGDEYHFSNFCSQNNLDGQSLIEKDLKQFLKSKSLDGKNRVVFQLRKRKVVISQNGVGVLAEKEISPKLIVVKVF